MFKRLALDHWQTTATLIAFGCIFGAFLLGAVRALCLRRAQLERLSHLPLEDDETPVDAARK